GQRVLIILLEQIIRAETVQWLLHFLVLFALTNDRIAMLFAAMQMVASGRFCCRSRLMNAVADDSVSLTRFVAEARDDGAAQSRPEAAFLFVLP
ncbi:MAG: hypothetical protein WAU99_23905, partial [Pseudolabrys sp.]